jgi:hypothetical protein
MKWKNFVEEDESVWAELLDDGRVSLRIHLQEFSPEGGPVDRAIQSWQENEEGTSTILELRFTLSSVLDLIEDGQLLYNRDGKPIPSELRLIGQEARPLLQALRSEMMEIIGRIDAINYG